MMRNTLLASVAALALSVAAAHATCVSTTAISAPDPSAGTTCAITAGAPTVDIVFAYKAAADIDLLINGTTTLLKNTDPLGTEVTLTGLMIGDPIDFVWKNMTTGDTFHAGVPASDGDQHIAVEASYTDFQTDPPRSYLTQADLGAAYGVMAGIAPIGTWDFVGMEDLLANQASDFDFNDIIFGMHGIAQSREVPMSEPSALALLGSALLGFRLWRQLRDRATRRGAYKILYSGFGE